MFHCLPTAQVTGTTTHPTERTKFHQGLSLKVSLQPWPLRERQPLCCTDLRAPQPLANRRIALPHALFSSRCDLFKSQRWVHFTHFKCQIQKHCNLTTLSLKGELVGFFPLNRISIAPYGHNGDRILTRLEINDQFFSYPEDIVWLSSSHNRSCQGTKSPLNPMEWLTGKEK